MPVIQGVGISPALTAPDVIGADYEHYGMKLVYLGIDSLKGAGANREEVLAVA